MKDQEILVKNLKQTASLIKKLIKNEFISMNSIMKKSYFP